jgi:hypothetical protein
MDMNEDKLILYYYNDGLTDAERGAIAAAIESDPAVAKQYAALCNELEQLAVEDAPPVPAHTVERWHDVIRDAPGARAATPRPAPRTFNPMSFALGAAVAAALVLAVMLNRDPVEPPLPMPTQASAAFERGVQVHFRDTQDQLATMPVESARERAALMMQIISQNRLFERAAEQNDADDLARVLRAFEAVLVRLAQEDLSPAEAQALRAKLAFELNVMLTKLSRDASNEADTGHTGIQT